jgi:hypothetical protein
MAKNIVWLTERVTLDYITEYELSNAITTRIMEINSTFQTYLDDKDLMINMNEIEKEKHKNIEVNDICSIGGQSFVKLNSTRDIARCEINLNKSPLSVVRIISEDDNNIYAEKIAVNDLHKPVLQYFRNYDY